MGWKRWMNTWLISRTKRLSRGWVENPAKAQETLFRAWIAVAARTELGTRLWLKPEGGQSVFKKNVLPQYPEVYAEFFTRFKSKGAPSLWTQDPETWIESPQFGALPVTPDGRRAWFDGLKEALFLYMAEENNPGLAEAKISLLLPPQFQALGTSIRQWVHPYYQKQVQALSPADVPEFPGILFGGAASLIQVLETAQQPIRPELVVVFGQGKTALIPLFKSGFQAPIRQIEMDEMGAHGFQSRKGDFGMTLFANHGSFMEFFKAETKEITGFDGLRPNETYELVLTNVNGLMRNRTGTMVELQPESMYCFDFLGNDHSFLDYGGYKIPPLRLEQALFDLQNESEIILQGFEIKPEEDELRFCLYLKSGKAKKGDLENELHHHLQARSKAYKNALLSKHLKPVKIETLSART